ncbi:hypothetical protein [Neisseria lactamica]|uniref:hypothetical protein n=1 Tax=Neisseria lactamica TaxID=486 RepID=UPI000E56744A|nr:hypothetical protein [Neisseria lactamica]
MNIPSWKVCPQTVRFYKTKAQAKAMWGIGKSLARAMDAQRRKKPMAAAPDFEAAAAPRLLDAHQADALLKRQALLAEIRKIKTELNRQNVVFDLGLPPVLFYEADVQVARIDDLIRAAQIAARRNGTTPVIGKINPAI